MNPALCRFDSVETALNAETNLSSFAAAGVLIWESRTRAIVVPDRMTRIAGFERAAARSAASGHEIAIRPTGGGIVPQGPGIINLAMTFPRTSGLLLEDAYRLLCEPIVDALTSYGVVVGTGAVAGSFCDGAFNLVVGGRKIGGTAQRWSGSDATARVHAHAVLLVDPQLAEAVGAVERFQRDLGVSGRLDLDVHTSLAREVGSTAPRPDFEILAGRVAREARRTLLRAGVREVAAQAA